MSKKNTEQGEFSTKSNAFNQHLNQQQISKQRDRLLIDVAEKLFYRGYTAENYPDFNESVFKSLVNQ